MKKLLLIFLCVPLIGLGQGNTVKIGSQIWTSQNLDIDRFRNGDIIPKAESKEEWLRASYKEDPIWCYYKFDDNYSHLGKLYNYYCISDEREIAPKGFKVPDFRDFYELITYLNPLITIENLDKGFMSVAGSLMSNDTIFWNNRCNNISSGLDIIGSGGYEPLVGDFQPDNWKEIKNKSYIWLYTDFPNDIKLFKSVISKEQWEERDKIVEKHQNKAWGVSFKKSTIGCDLNLEPERKESGYSIRLIKE